MKKYITILGCLTFFFIGMNSSNAQEVNSKQSEAAMKQSIIDHDSAKKQTFDLHQLVNLSGDQVSKVHDMFLDLDKRQSQISTKSDDGVIKEQIIKLESLKNENLKEILTNDQYGIYLKSLNLK